MSGAQPIHTVAVEGFDGWRAAARALLAAGVESRAVAWREAGEAQESLLEDGPARAPEAPAEAGPALRVSRRFLAVARAVACHRDPERWARLYAVLWRIARGEPRLMEVATDPEVHALLRMEKAVRRETHKLKAFVRFREVPEEPGTRFVAWFEPEHDVLARAAPFFAERFAAMRWSILTPRESAHWDGASLRMGGGVGRASAPDGDGVEALWRTYYASTFNPGRLRTRAMRSEMPARYWKNLPEAAEIAPLVAGAPGRVRRMLEGTAGEEELPRRRAREPRKRS